MLEGIKSKGNDNSFELLGGLRNQGLEKSVFYCIHCMNIVLISHFVKCHAHWKVEFDYT